MANTEALCHRRLTHARARAHASERAQVDEVKNIMSENIEKVLNRGEKLDMLVDKTDNLMFEASAGPTGPPSQDAH